MLHRPTCFLNLPIFIRRKSYLTKPLWLRNCLEIAVVSQKVWPHLFFKVHEKEFIPR